MQRIFLSYSRADSEFVLKLARDLRSAGANIWLDQLDIPTGKRWDLAVEEALTHANHLIVILSESSVASNNVMDEVSYAIEQKKMIFPVVINNCNIPFRLKRLQYIDFIVDYDKGLAKLLTDLGIKQSSATKTSGSYKQAKSDVLFTDTGKKNSRIKSGERKKAFLLKWGVIGTIPIVIVFIVLYVLLQFNLPIFRGNPKLVSLENTGLQNILVWKVGSPHIGDTPDTTKPFQLQSEAKKMGFNLTVEGFPAKGFAAKFFEAVEKHEEPDILVIDNYGIIDGITTDLGNFTGIGTSSNIRDDLVFVTNSLKEFESGQGGWQILVLTSRNHQEAKSLALRLPHCDPELKETVASELQKSTYKYILDKFDPKPGSNLNLTICEFWGNQNIAFLNTTVTYEAEKSLGWVSLLVIMERKDSSWELVTSGDNVSLITELNKEVRLVDTSHKTPLQNNLKIIGPPDGIESTRTSKPSLEWEWSGDIKSIACYLIEAQFGSDGEWSGSHFRLIPPQKNVKQVAHFGVGAQPHRWKVWVIDNKGSIVRSSWSTINYTY